MIPTKEFASLIGAIAQEAGNIAFTHFRSLATLPVERKGHLDLVTEADKAVEAFIVDRLRRMFPDDGVFGEEGASAPTRTGRTWVIDPIDGTFNFVRGAQDWAISIGLQQDGRPAFGAIYAPVRDLLLMGGEGVETTLNGTPMGRIPPYETSRAVTSLGLHPSLSMPDRLEAIRYVTEDMGISFRVTGASTASLISVAMGETDGYIALGDSTWDVMAGLPILANLGVSHTIDWERTSLGDKLRFACGSAEFLAHVRVLLARVSHGHVAAGE